MAKQTSHRSTAKNEQDRVDRTYRRTAGKYSKKKAARQRRNSIIAICIALIAVIGVIVAGFFLFSGEEDNGLILKNVSIGGIDVGEMPPEDAVVAVTDAISDIYAKNSMKVTVLEHSIEITPEDANVSVDAQKAVDTAYSYGRTGSATDKAQDKLDAINGIAVDITPFLSYNTDTIRSKLNDLGANYSSILRQTQYEIENADNGLPAKLIVTMGTPEHRLDLEALYNQVIKAYAAQKFAVEGKCTITEPDAFDLNAIYTQYCTAPKDAYIDKNTYEIIEGVSGYGFDLEVAQAKLDSAAAGAKVEISFSEIKPAVSAADLEKDMFKDELGKITVTQYDSDAGRNQNLQKACESIHNVVLNPGEVFSYNDLLGERTAENGYALGPSYAGNETVLTYGGGICQVSSALYTCCLQADLEIIEREEHGFFPGYVEWGMDAMVNWGTRDFRFSNNANYPIRIEATAQGGSVTVRILGTNDKNYTVSFEVKTLSEDPAESTVKTYSSNNEKGYKNGDVVSEGYDGRKVEVYMIKTDHDTGEVTKVLINTSTYRRRDEVICVIEDPVEDNNSGQTGNGGTQGNIGGGVSDGDGGLPSEDEME